jgi:5-methyltetrahydropteroyltriglutamate--homocysteine methyltransferase
MDSMRRSDSRILSTHTGSLARPAPLLELLLARDDGQAIDEAAFDKVVTGAVQDVVARQVEIGLDSVNDGEMSKLAFNAYPRERFSGLGGNYERRTPADVADHPDLAELMAARRARRTHWPACVGPIEYVGQAAVARDIANFRQALASTPPEEAFMTAAAPGAIAVVIGEGYYPTYAKHVEAIGNAMRTEYQAIVDAGFVLQLDAPDLAMERGWKFRDGSLEDFRRVVALHIDVLNDAIRGLPPEQLRLHVCWGNYIGPHHLDVPLREVIDLILKAHVGGLSIEAANPRHEHEWRLFEDVRLPDGMVLIPGVIDSCSTYAEHPELVAERIVRYARLVGRENVIAGTDCGFGTFAGASVVAPSVSWRKLAALTEGARLASSTLWSS